MSARNHKDIARIDKTNLAGKQYVRDSSDEGRKKDGDINLSVEIDINERLFLERNRNFKPEQVWTTRPGGNKVSLTSNIFGEHRYF